VGGSPRRKYSDLRKTRSPDMEVMIQSNERLVFKNKDRFGGPGVHWGLLYDPEVHFHNQRLKIRSGLMAINYFKRRRIFAFNGLR
jgi:hypothetical protein